MSRNAKVGFKLANFRLPTSVGNIANRSGLMLTFSGKMYKSQNGLVMVLEK